MERIKSFINEKSHIIISLPAFLCFTTFVTNFVSALKDWNIDTNEYHQLLATADGFETIVLGLVAIAIKSKK